MKHLIAAMLGGRDNETARSIPLQFLGKGRFTARVIGDGVEPTMLSDRRMTVSAASSLALELGATGGVVMLIEPVR